MLTFVVQNDPFFWDTIQLASKHAHCFFDNNLRFALLPSTLDSGHPPLLGYYLAVCWTFFGKNLPVGHWAMLPFAVGIACLLLGLSKRLVGAELGLFLLPLVLLDPVFLGQMVMVSPDTILFCFFLLVVEGVFSEKKTWVMLGVLGLCCVSMRGMMTAGALFVWCLWDILQGFNRSATPTLAGCRAFSQQFICGLLPFIPGFLAAMAFLSWHYTATGWIGFHPASSWAPAFERVGAQGLLKNMAVFSWRWLDFGRVGECLAFLFLGGLPFWFKKNNLTTHSNQQAIEQNKHSSKSLFWILLLFLAPSALLYHNLSAHRYFLPLFFAFHLLAVQCIAQMDVSMFRKRILLFIVVACLAFGNLWRNPIGISMDWDATLGHLPYHALRAEMLGFIDQQRIDYQLIGTSFPNYNTGNDIYLNGDQRLFSEKDFAKNTYMLWSNVLNDFSKEDFETLERKWVLVKKIEKNGVVMGLYRK